MPAAPNAAVAVADVNGLKPRTPIVIHGEPHVRWYKLDPAAKREGVTSARVEVTVDQASIDGLNFFALQVNFTNNTWAHGGLQLLKGDHEYINWGGLPNLGGGKGDYGDRTPEQLKQDLERIQNPSDGQQLVDADWEPGVRYVYEITRGERVILPPGDYRRSSGDPAVYIDHPRELYEWNFSVLPAAGGEPLYQGTMYNSAASVQAVAIWNESGYGSTQDQLISTWEHPTYIAGDTEYDAGVSTRAQRG